MPNTARLFPLSTRSSFQNSIVSQPVRKNSPLYAKNVGLTPPLMTGTIPCMKRVLAFLALMMIWSPAYAGLLGPDNFDDCILEKMPGVTSNAAASAIWQACRNKFPADKKKDDQRSRPAEQSSAHGHSLEEVAGALIGHYQSRLVTISACTVTKTPQDSESIKDPATKAVDRQAWEMFDDLWKKDSNIVDALERAVVDYRVSKGLPATLENVKDQVDALMPYQGKVAKRLHDEYAAEWGSHAEGCKKLLPFIASNMSLMDCCQADLKFVLGPKYYLYKFDVPSYGHK